MWPAADTEQCEREGHKIDWYTILIIQIPRPALSSTCAANPRRLASRNVPSPVRNTSYGGDRSPTARTAFQGPLHYADATATTAGLRSSTISVMAMTVSTVPNHGIV